MFVFVMRMRVRFNFVRMRLMRVIVVRVTVRRFLLTDFCRLPLLRKLPLKFVFVRFAVQRNRNRKRVNAVFENRLCLDFPAFNRQSAQTFAQCFNWHAAIYQRRQSHVARDAAKTIEVSNGHNF